MKRHYRLSFVAVALLLAGCSTSKQSQLDHVARDWCMTIRASQVIPVYPLTEDIQPGDIFLVQVPIDRQQEVYKKRGFLALDNHIARLDPTGYTNFYDHSFFGGGGNALLPHDWMRPINTNTPPWKPAPHAAFPTYSFSVRRGGGLNLAVPIQGVPVGLSLLGSDAAYGSVSIKNAATVGVDILSLHGQVASWAKANSPFLDKFSPSKNETNYLRVVTRIYATGELDVELRDASSRSAGLDVGAAKPVNLLFPQLASGKSNIAETVVTNYMNGWNALTNLLNLATSAAGNFAPGGSLRLTAASARTVALQETFNPPLLIGYLGFDCAILGHGQLGAPIPTHSALDSKARLHRASVEQYNVSINQQIQSFEAVSSKYSTAPPARQAEIRKIAREMKLSSDGDGTNWIQGLGIIVDGTDVTKTQRFLELRKQVEALR